MAAGAFGFAADQKKKSNVTKPLVVAAEERDDDDDNNYHTPTPAPVQCEYKFVYDAPEVEGMLGAGTFYYGPGGKIYLFPYFAQPPTPIPTPMPSELIGLSINGVASLNENTSGLFTATATYKDGATRTVIPVWSEDSPYATISTQGTLSVQAVTKNEVVNLLASYTESNITKTSIKKVTIVDVLPTPTPTCTGPALNAMYNNKPLCASCHRNRTNTGTIHNSHKQNCCVCHPTK